jgi:enterochelin esterase-like enzyme
MRVLSDSEIMADRSRAIERTVTSAALGRHVDYTLLLPRDIEGGRRFPVLYLLHGRGDDHRSWNEKSSVAAFTADLPLIIVMPDAKQTRYLNTPGGGQYQDFFQGELVPHIDATLPTIATREGRATAGLSMGGYGAWRLALLAADRFVSAAALSGSLDWGVADPQEYPVYVDLVRHLYGDAPDARERYAADAIWPLIAHHRNGLSWTGPALYFACGTGDRHITHNRELQQQLQAAGVPHTYAEDFGFHEWSFWEKYVRHAIAFTMLHLADSRSGGRCA